MSKNEPAGNSRGSIICTASNAGLYPFPLSPLYAATKAGVIGLVRSAGPMLKDKNIQINALAPAVLGEQRPMHASLSRWLLLLTNLHSDQHRSGQGDIQGHDRYAHVNTGEGRGSVYL